MSLLRLGVHGDARALWVHQHGDAVTTRYFHRTVDDLAARFRRALGRVVRVVDQDIVQPERRAGHGRDFFVDAAIGEAIAAEHPVLPARTQPITGAHVEAVLLHPAEQPGVERPRRVGIGGGQLVPGDGERLWIGFLLHLLLALVYGDYRALRVAEDSETTVSGHAHGRGNDGSAAGLRLFDRFVEIQRAE